MTPAEMAGVLKVSRPLIAQRIVEGVFTVAGHKLRATRKGHRWDVEFERDDQSRSAAERGNLGGRPAGGSQTMPMEQLRAKKLWTDIRLGEQKLAEHDRQMRKRFADIVFRALKDAGSDWASHVRALRLSPEQADAVTDLALRWKGELRRMVADGVAEWEAESAQ